MKLKSIKLTNKFKKIPFKVIKNDLDKDLDGDHYVLTPTGWSKVLGFNYIKNGPSKVIRHSTDRLVCDPGHVLMIDRGGVCTAVSADQLDVTTDKLYSLNDKLVDFEVDDGLNEDFYDISIGDPHWWFTSDVVSHNSIVLCNNAISSLKGEGSGGEIGQDVLLITFELDSIKTAMRCLGAATSVPLNHVVEKQDFIRRVIGTMERTYKKKFAIYEWPPDECSVTHIYTLLDSLKRTKGWKPDVIIIDYLDLMMSRNENYNKTDYDRQKHVANEIRGLAKNEEVLIFTATQTNRSGSGGSISSGEVADLDKAAESFAKQFSLDYVVSLNQSIGERKATPPRMRFFVAKNRNGPKHDTVECQIEYDKMLVREL